MRRRFVQLGAWQRFSGTVEPSTRRAPPSVFETDRWAYNSWRVVLRFDGRRMTTPFFTGWLALPPEPCGVLETLAADAAMYESTGGSVEEWAAEFGLVAETRAQERQQRATFRAVERETMKLRKFLGDDYETVLYHDDLESWCRGQKSIP